MVKDIMKWVLTIVSGLLLLFASYTLNSISSDIESQDKKIDEIKTVLSASVFVDSLHILRIIDLEKTVVDHIEDEDIHK